MAGTVGYWDIKPGFTFTARGERRNRYRVIRTRGRLATVERERDGWQWVCGRAQVLQYAAPEAGQAVREGKHGQLKLF